MTSEEASALLEEIVRQAGRIDCDYDVIDENVRRLREHLTGAPGVAALRTLVEALDRGRALVPNGNLLLEVQADVGDDLLWQSDASMLLDQDDLAALRRLVAPGEP